MKKCAIFFVLFIVALVVAALTENMEENLGIVEEVAMTDDVNLPIMEETNLAENE